MPPPAPSPAARYDRPGPRIRTHSATHAAAPVPIGVGSPAAATVLTAVRRAGIAFRDELVTATGLSHATVNRQVVALLKTGVLRERPDLVPAGTIGRPRVAVEIDRERYGVLGIHVGLQRTTLSVGDLRGTVLGAVDVPTPRDDPAEALASLTGRLRLFGGRHPDRTFLQVGVVVGGQLSADRQRLGHERLGWGAAPIAEIVSRVALSDVVVVPQIEAMAGAESLLSPYLDEGSTLLVYAREAVGAVLTVDGRVHAPTAGPGTISHLPVGGGAACPCGRDGCLEAAVGDAAVAAAAHEAGIVDAPSIEQVIAAADDGSRAAHELLVERGHLLGRGVALVRDVLNPDRVLLAGQAFTAYRPGLAHVSEAFSRYTTLHPMSLQISAFGPALQAVAACTAGLRPVFADPIGVLRKVAARGAVEPPSGPTPLRKATSR